VVLVVRLEGGRKAAGDEWWRRWLSGVLALVAAGHGKGSGWWRLTARSVLSMMQCSVELDGECGHGDEYGGGGELR
jgi:hypothetical protein